jgi:hypothetical protein
MAKYKPQWEDRPQTHDYAAALNYLTLQFTTATAKRLIKQARQARRIERAAKDILRASNLPLLAAEELHVAEDLKRIRKGKPISPIILVQGDLAKGRTFVIADGYHRMCAACHANEDAPVAAIMVEL